MHVGSGASAGITGSSPPARCRIRPTYASNLAGRDFATVWCASAGYYPQLYGVNYVLRVDPANASRVYGDANPAFT